MNFNFVLITFEIVIISNERIISFSFLLNFKAQRKKIAHKWIRSRVFCKIGKDPRTRDRFLGKLCFLSNESILSKWDTDGSCRWFSIQSQTAIRFNSTLFFFPFFCKTFFMKEKSRFKQFRIINLPKFAKKMVIRVYINSLAS